VSRNLTFLQTSSIRSSTSKLDRIGAEV
jgi:hypothetical protein